MGMRYWQRYDARYKLCNIKNLSRAKREYGEYVTAVKWKNIVNEIRFQYAMLNVMLNGINVYSIV